MPEKSSVFDMIGPIMIGPSSSHTAGVVRIAKASTKVLGGLPDEAEIIFYNSFARTYEGHGSVSFSYCCIYSICFKYKLV